MAWGESRRSRNASSELAREIAVVIVEQHVKLALRVSRYCLCHGARPHCPRKARRAQVEDDPELFRLLSP